MKGFGNLAFDVGWKVLGSVHVAVCLDCKISGEGRARAGATSNKVDRIPMMKGSVKENGELLEHLQFESLGTGRNQEASAVLIYTYTLYRLSGRSISPSG